MYSGVYGFLDRIIGKNWMCLGFQNILKQMHAAESCDELLRRNLEWKCLFDGMYVILYLSRDRSLDTESLIFTNLNHYRVYHFDGHSYRRWWEHSSSAQCNQSINWIENLSKRSRGWYSVSLRNLSEWNFIQKSHNPSPKSETNWSLPSNFFCLRYFWCIFKISNTLSFLKIKMLLRAWRSCLTKGNVLSTENIESFVQIVDHQKTDINMLWYRINSYQHTLWSSEC